MHTACQFMLIVSGMFIVYVRRLCLETRVVSLSLSDF